MKKRNTFQRLLAQKEAIHLIGATATATEMQNNFGRYLSIVIGGDEVIVTRNGKEVGRFIPKGATISYLTDSLTGILKGGADPETERDAALRAKYEIAD